MCGGGKGEQPNYIPVQYAEQVHLMYMPWSGNLTSYFRVNIADMERVVAKGLDRSIRVLVFFMENENQASLFELYHSRDKCLRRRIKTYDPPIDFTAEEGIAAILSDVRREAPAKRYTMSIGSHGMAWIPARPAVRMRSAAESRKEYWEYASPERPLTRWFGGTERRHRTDIETLAGAIDRAGMHMEYILFDDCYMSSVEVAYALRRVTDFLIGSTSEIMAYGFPYALAGRHMLGTVDYEAICEEFHRFYSTYAYPYGTIGVTRCSELEPLARIMKRINEANTFDPEQVGQLQRLDGYTPTLFFDLGDYVRHLCADAALLDEFERQLARTVPWHRHTDYYYSMTNGTNRIDTFSGITTSDPSIEPSVREQRRHTAWYAATHP